MLGIVGSAEEVALLTSKGFTETRDRLNDIYYCKYGRHLVRFYSDGTWSSEAAAEGVTLEEYLNSIE
jgi:hypothetical protein